MALSIRQLTYFLAVVDTGRFTQAAALCRVAQPTLSKQVRALETELGESLFTRSHDNITPTAAGETLLPLARRIVADSETARQEIAELAGLRKGRLRLGATPSLCVSVVADVLAFFHGRYPGIALAVTEGGSQDLVRDLERGQLDLALVIDSPAVRAGRASHPEPDGAAGYDRGDLRLTPVLREELVAVSAAGAPDLGDHIGVVELAGHPLVINRPGYDLREVTLAACASAGVEPRIAVEAGEMDSLLRMVERGIGVAIVPSLVLGGHPGLRATRLDASGGHEAWGHRTIALAHRTDVTLTRAALAFRADLLAVLSRTARTGGLPPGVRYVHG